VQTADGHLLTVINDVAAEASQIAVFDARDLSTAPVAVVHLPAGCPAASTATGSPILKPPTTDLLTPALAVHFLPGKASAACGQRPPTRR
jgi:Retinal pigment epithelial membrane protein